MSIRGSNALKSEYLDDNMLPNYIDSVRSEIELATLRFNEMTDEKAIDYASYNLLAAKAKYSYLIQLAKDKKISL